MVTIQYLLLIKEKDKKKSWIISECFGIALVTNVVKFFALSVFQGENTIS